MMRYPVGMRTTVQLDDDVVAEVERLRREHGLGLSEAVNTLARQGMVRPEGTSAYVHRSASVGLTVDVTDIGAVLDLLDDA